MREKLAGNWLREAFGVRRCASLLFLVFSCTLEACAHEKRRVADALQTLRAVRCGPVHTIYRFWGRRHRNRHSRADLSTTFEFKLQGGGGLHYFLRDDLALTFQWRFIHFSNAGIKYPNTGVNNSTFLLGVSWFFGKHALSSSSIHRPRPRWIYSACSALLSVSISVHLWFK